MTVKYDLVQTQQLQDINRVARLRVVQVPDDKVSFASEKKSQTSFDVLRLRIGTLERLKFSGERIDASQSAYTRRLNGPVQFIKRLVGDWQIEREETSSIFGFDQTDPSYMDRLFNGRDVLRGELHFSS